MGEQRDAGHNPDANLKLSQGFGSARRPTASRSALVVASCPPNPPTRLAEARSPVEAIDFVAAYSRDASKAELFESRSLIVDNIASWHAIVAQAERNLILIPHPSFAIEPEMG